MKNERNLLNLLEQFNEAFSGWEFAERNPWQKQAPYDLIEDVIIDPGKGIYMLSDYFGPYYIGKAEDNRGGLFNRLPGKLRADRNHPIYKQRYLKHYVRNDSTLNYMYTGGKWAREAEDILLGVCIKLRGKDKLYNKKTGAVCKAIIQSTDSEVSVLIDEIASKFSIK